ncbi:MAG: hypothetical protein JXB07_09030 [Anaerolineae bacterium]|nr:hypothetical protein [Anaerolineae bacterium]
MTLSRRDSIRAFGMVLASLLLTRCKGLRLSSVPTPAPTCYTVVPTPRPTSISMWALSEPRDRLRACWLSFDDLANRTSSGKNQGSDSWDNPLGRSLSADHRQALDELVAAGEIEAPVADLVQEAYDAAVYHIWRSNVMITCYEPMEVDFKPVSAGQLVQQSAVLSQMAEEGQLDPEIVATAQQAIERDLAFEALTDEEVRALYQTLIDEFNQTGSSIPSFEEATLDITPEALEAAQFLVELLTER